QSAVVVQVTLEVNLPQDPVEDVRGEETVWLELSGSHRRPPKPIMARPDFPPLYHSSERVIAGVPHRELCLVRVSPADWWVARTLVDAAVRTKEWLEDAAAGCLVKRDDPFEPLIVEDLGGVVELDRARARAAALKHGPAFRANCTVSADRTRLVVFEGDVPVLGLYQQQPSNVAWPARLGTLDQIR